MKTKFKEIQNSLIQLFKNKVFILLIILIAADLRVGNLAYRLGYSDYLSEGNGLNF